jgi:hypothetical protein
MFALRAPLVAFVYCVARLCAICPSRARVQYLGCAFVPMFASRVCVLHCAFVPMFALRVPIVAFVYCVPVCALRRAFVCMRPRFCSVYRLRRAFVCNVCVARSRAIFTLRVRSKVCVARLCIALRVRSNACVARSNIRAALVRPGDFRAALVRPGALVGPKFEFRNLKILAAFFWGRW